MRIKMKEETITKAIEILKSVGEHVLDRQEIHTLLQHFRGLNKVEAKATATPWQPKDGEEYGYVNQAGYVLIDTWDGREFDRYNLSIGNVCPITKSYALAIWEQTTKRQYAHALQIAAKQSWLDAGLVMDWDSHEYNKYFTYWEHHEKKLYADGRNFTQCANTPYFASAQSCIDAHERILGSDLSRYLTEVQS